MVECPECGAGADLTADGSYAHCASCMLALSNRYSSPRTLCAHPNSGNNIFEPNKPGSSEKGTGSGSGDKDQSEDQTKVKQADESKAGEQKADGK